MLFLNTSLNREDVQKRKDILGSGPVIPHQSMGFVEKCGWKWCSVPLSTPDKMSPQLLCSSDMTVSRKMFWIPYDFLLRYSTIKGEHLLGAHAIFPDALSTAEILFRNLWNIRNIAVRMNRKCFYHHISPTEILWFWGQKNICCLWIGAVLLQYLLHISCWEALMTNIREEREEETNVRRNFRVLSASGRDWRY